MARFTADVTCMDINTDKGELLVAGSADMTVKVVNTASYEVMATFEGHSAPILSVSIDCQGKYVASSSCDGSIRYAKFCIKLECLQTWPLIQEYFYLHFVL